MNDQDIPTIIAVLQEKQNRQEAQQLAVLNKLDLILAKFDLLPDVYVPRREWVDFKVEYARQGLEVSKRLDLMDARADAIRLWLIGSLGSAVLALALIALPHVAGPH